MTQKIQAPAAGPAAEGALSPSWRAANVATGFTLAAVGDLILSDELYPRLRRQSPELLWMLQNADVTFGNFEGTAIDLRKFGGYPSALSGGSWLVSTPRVPKDIKAMGFDCVSLANNHTTDWGVEGMRYTAGLLDEAGVVHAGTGETLAQARAPQYFNGAAGRVALVALASRYEENARAIDPLGQIPGRPGLNALRATRHALVSPEHFATLAAIRDALPRGAMRKSVLAADAKNNTVTLLDKKFKQHPDYQGAVEFTFTVDERDLKEIVLNIRQAKQSADFAIVSLHTHEPGNYSEAPPDFMQRVARDSIDHGADAFIGHGPHQLRGIEIYKGRPIYYSLGNFFFMENTQQPITRDEFDKDKVVPGAQTEAEFMEHRRVHGVFKEQVWYESVVALNRYDAHGAITEILLHPIEMHWRGGRDADRGIPRLAPPDDAARILARLQRLSAPYGTVIRVVDGVGVITVER